MDLAEFQELCEQAGCSRLMFEHDLATMKLRVVFMANARDGIANSLEEVAEQLQSHLEAK